MKIGDPRQINGRYMPDGTIQHVNIGIGSLTGQAQSLTLDDGTTVQGLAVRSFLDSQEIVCPTDLCPAAPAGTKPNPNPIGANFHIGSKTTFGKAYLLDTKYGSPRGLDSSGKTVNNFGPAIVTGRDFVEIGAVRTQVWCFRQDLLKLEWCSPV